MLGLLGVTERGSHNGQTAIPEPLPLGASPRTNAEGVRLHNPSWRESSTLPTNSEYIDAATDLILERENVSSFSNSQMTVRLTNS